MTWGESYFSYFSRIYLINIFLMIFTSLSYLPLHLLGTGTIQTTEGKLLISLLLIACSLMLSYGLGPPNASEIFSSVSSYCQASCVLYYYFSLLHGVCGFTLQYCWSLFPSCIRYDKHCIQCSSGLAVCFPQNAENCCLLLPFLTSSVAELAFANAALCTYGTSWLPHCCMHLEPKDLLLLCVEP